MSGKSRTGAHALITHPVLSQRRLLIPKSDADIRQVIDVVPTNGAVLWLDDLTRFGAGLTVSVLRNWQERQGLVVVGTLRSDYANQFRVNPKMRPLLEVLEDQSLVETFHIAREWSEEDQRALAGADLRIREKVADGWSLGEVLGAAPELWNYLKGAKPFQRAVALTVLDWVRTGISTSITADQAEELWTHYLPPLESNRLKDKAPDRQHLDFTEALKWAEIPCPQTSTTIISRQEDRLLPERYLVARRSSSGEQIPRAIWEAALNCAKKSNDLASLVIMGHLAGRAGVDDIAQSALEAAIATRDSNIAPQAAFHLGLLKSKNKNLDEAQAAFTFAINSGHETYGPQSRLNLAALLEEHGHYEAAVSAYRATIKNGNSDFAPMAAICLGMLLAKLGDVAGAQNSYQIAVASGHPEWSAQATYHLRRLPDVQGDVTGT